MHRIGNMTGMDWDSFFSRLDELKDERGMTDTALSVAAGLSKDGIRNWRRNASKRPNSHPSMSSLTRVANYLGVSVDYLTEGEPGLLQTGFAEKFDFAESYKPLPTMPATPSASNLAEENTPEDPNNLRITVVGNTVEIVARLDKEGLEQLRYKIDNLISLLD